MSLRHCRNWIFDLDGTLTLAVHDFDAIRATLGLPRGQPVLEAIACLPDEQARAARQRLHAIEWQLACAARPQPGAQQLLAHLTAQGRQLGIVTRNGTAIANKTLQSCGFDQFFRKDAVVGRELCIPKPDPAGILHLLKHWRATASRTVMIGDHQMDMQAGRRAGVKTVHFDQRDGRANTEFADLKISSLARLIPLSAAD